MKICVVTGGYPSPGRPEYPFVEQLCNEWAAQGHTINVLVPHSRTKRILRNLKKVDLIRNTFAGKGCVTVYSPEYWTFGNFGDKGLNQKLLKRVINHFSAEIEKPDIVYAHFWHNGRAAFDIAKKWNVPLIVASGEAEIEQTVKTKSDKEFVDYVKSVVCVSTKNLNESVRRGLTKPEKCHVFPNAIDQTIFFKKDKTEARAKLGFSNNDFIVCFVGGFIPRKGPDRVSAAIKSLNCPNIKSIFIGGNRDGSMLRPDCDGILFEGKLAHNDIPLYLNSSDCFVLPTLHEGCCNAIVEAMACGLPIISSDLEFNWDILNSSNSILIDPMNISEIANAIKKIYESSELQRSMSEHSLLTASNLTISNRASHIIEFIKEKNQL